MTARVKIAPVSALVTVTESWLNAHAHPETRGRLLSVYGMVTMAAWAASQLLLNVADPGGIVLFCVVSILVSLALVPVALTRSTVPVVAGPSRISLRRLYAISP